jgi:glycosyltransferase involved in cell wall biosynthesis
MLPVPTGCFTMHDGVRVWFLPRWSPTLKVLREFQVGEGFESWMKQHLASYDCVHVHAVFSFMSTVAMRCARRQGVPYIARPLGQLDVWSLKQKALKKKLYYFLIERGNLENASAIHCTSDTEAANVMALLPRARAVVVAHGVEPPIEPKDARLLLRDANRLPSDEPVILFLSRWHEKKNIPTLLRALVRMMDVRWSLVLAGTTDDRDYEQSIQKLIDELGLRSRIHCPGHVTGEAKAELLYGADVFVLPSLTENFGIAVAEALVCGLRVVVSPGVDIAPAVVALSGGEVCSAEESALSEALRRLLSTSWDRNRLALAARQQFSWGTAVMKLQSLYASARR